MKSKLPACLAIASASLEITTSWAPSRIASCVFPGEVVKTTTLARAASDGLPPPVAVLDANNTYPYFDALGDLIMTGPSGTNVGDLQVFLLA